MQGSLLPGRDKSQVLVWAKGSTMQGQGHLSLGLGRTRALYSQPQGSFSKCMLKAPS